MKKVSRIVKPVSLLYIIALLHFVYAHLGLYICWETYRAE
jgi:hypothetical protein